MAPNKLHGTGRRRSKIIWSHERRLGLHMLERFHLSSSEKDQVFGAVFGVNEIREQALRSQYAEHTSPDKAHRWHSVLSEAKSPEEKNLRRDLQDRIANAILQVKNGTAEQPSPEVSSSSAKQASPQVNSRSAEQASSQVDNGSTEQIGNEDIVYEEPEQEPALPEPPKKRRRERPERRERRMVMRREAFVVIPRVSSQLVNAPQRSVPPTPPETPAKVPYPRRLGGSLHLTPKAIAKIPATYSSPAEEELHPCELPALFYRFWSGHPRATHCLNSRDGFIAGKYFDSNMRWDALPEGYVIDPTDVFNHIEGRKDKPSPFVSVSANLNWTLNNAIKESRRGKKIMVSVITSAQLNRKEVFYSRPLMGRLKAHKSLTEGKWMYGSSNEFWIWNSIPKAAILKTFSLDELTEMNTSSPAGIGAVLRLGVLARTPDTRLRAALEAGGVKINEVVAATLGDLAQFFGLSSNSLLEQLSFFVADVVHGFAIEVSHHSAAEWNDYAAVFSHSFNLGSIRPISIANQMKLRAAFLQGLSLSMRPYTIKNFALHSSAPFLQKLQRKITSVGLEDPAALTQDLEDARLQALQYKKSFQRRLQPTRSQMLLEDGIEGAEDQDDEEMSDMISQFELNDDGIVV